MPPFRPRRNHTRLSTVISVVNTQTYRVATNFGREKGPYMFMGCAEVYEHTIVWGWQGNDAYTRSDIDGFRVYLNYGNLNNSDEYVEEGEVGSVNQVFATDFPGCNATWGYQVEAFVSGSETTGEPERVSARSDPIYLHGPVCQHAYDVVRFTLDTLKVEEIDDGIETCGFLCIRGDDKVEAYGVGMLGIIHADGTGGEFALFSFWDQDCRGGYGPICTGESFTDEEIWDAEPSDWHRLGEGTLNLSDENLAICHFSNDLATGALIATSDSCKDLGPGNNSVALTISRGGDKVIFNFLLWDDDDGTGDDVWCGNVEDYVWPFGPSDFKPFELAHVYENWEQMPSRIEQFDNFTGGYDLDQDAECTLTVKADWIHEIPGVWPTP